MRLLEVRNGKGLQFTLSLDRAADISRLSVMGINFGYFSPAGYVSPAYYDPNGAGFLKSFTAGFLTTCGLTNVGSPCEDGGESLGLHGTIGNTPAESYSVSYEGDKMIIKATVPDTRFFGHKLVLARTFTVSLTENVLTVKDEVSNLGNTEEPFQMLYHYNIGYPLLSEDAVVTIPAKKVVPRNAHAAEDLANCLVMEKPTKGYEERCYYHEMDGMAKVCVENPKIGRGLTMEYDTKNLPCFTEWKMMGEYEYVLGIEPGNAYPDGRDVMREKGMLQFIAPGETKVHEVKFTFA
jgi:galactose mutarotase-like enzyme